MRWVNTFETQSWRTAHGGQYRKPLSLRRPGRPALWRLEGLYLALEAEGRFVSYRFPRPFGDENEEPFNAPEKPGPSYWLGVQLYNLVGKPEVIPRAFILGWFAIVVVAVVNTSAAWGAQLSEAIALSF